MLELTSHSHDAPAPEDEILWKDGERVFCRRRRRDGGNILICGLPPNIHRPPASIASLTNSD